MLSNFKGFLKSFSFAINGIVTAAKIGRNLRFMLCAGVIATTFGYITGINRLEWAVLAIIIGLVISCELLNTAIESAVDLSTDSYHHLAQIAKDVSASAVLVTSFASIVVGIMLFFTQNRLALIFDHIGEHKLSWILALVLMTFFIYKPKNKQ